MRHPLSSLMCCLAAVATSTVAAGAELPKESLSWLELRTPHFRMLSTASERESREVILQFETYRAALLRALGGNASSAAAAGLELPIHVYLVSKDSFLRDYSSFKNRPAYFLNGRDGAHIMMRAGGGQEAWGMVYHEYVHYHVHRVAPDLAYPLWVNEGLATTYGETHIERDRVVFGTANPDFLRALMKRPRMRLRQLMGIGHASEEYQEGSEVQRFYASSWFVTYYLMIASPHRSRQLPEYLGRLRAGQPAEQAFSSAFRTTPEGLDQEMDDFQKQFHLQLPMRFCPRSEIKVEAVVDVKPCSYQEAMGQLGILRLSLQGAPGLPAAEHFKAALQRQPEAPTALLGQGLLAQAENRGAEAREWLGKAWKASTDLRHRYQCARAELMLGDLTPTRGSELLDCLNQCVEQGIGEPETLIFISQCLISSSTVALESLDQLERLARRANAIPAAALAAGMALERHGRAERAEEIYQGVAKSPSGRDAQQASSFLEAIAHRKVFEQQRKVDDAARAEITLAVDDFNAGRHDQGLGRLRELRARSLSSDLVNRIESLIAELERAKAAAAKPAPSPRKTKKG